MADKTPAERLAELLGKNKTSATKTATSKTTPQGKRSEVNTYSPEVAAHVASEEKRGYKPIPSGIDRTKRASNQPEAGGNLYGNAKWDATEQADFKARHPWVFNQKPDWNPHKAEDVQWFQDQYDKEHPGYFNQTDKKGNYVEGTSKNGKFGDHTLLAPGWTKDGAPAVEDKTKVAGTEDKAPPVVDTAVVKGNNKQVPADFWLQDIIKTAGAVGDRYRINKYLPWQAPYSPHLPQATFYDPTRELAQNSEQANIAAQAAGMFGSPQELSARLSAIQGQAAGQAGNILGKYNNMNVSASNLNEQQRTGALNEAGQYNATNATNLYDKNVIANQNFDNSKAQARAQIRGSFIDAITNRANAQALNGIQRQYQVNPLSGGTHSFSKPGKDFAEENYQNGLRKLSQTLGANGSSEDDVVNHLINKRGYTKKEAWDKVDKLREQQSETSSGSYGG